MYYIPVSKFFECPFCGHCFIYSRALFRLGVFAALFGVATAIFILNVDGIGAGIPGFGSRQHAGLIVATVIILIGLLVVFKMRK